MAKRRCREGDLLGIGFGAASGAITVGAINSTLHVEYPPMRTVLNLATRLCERAVGQDSLVDGSWPGARSQAITGGGVAMICGNSGVV